MKMLFEKDWGFLAGEVSKYKCDVFPRISITTIPQCMEIIFGFLCFRLQFTIWSRVMQEFNRRTRESGGQ